VGPHLLNFSLQSLSRVSWQPLRALLECTPKNRNPTTLSARPTQPIYTPPMCALQDEVRQLKFRLAAVQGSSTAGRPLLSA